MPIQVSALFDNKMTMRYNIIIYDIIFILVKAHRTVVVGGTPAPPQKFRMAARLGHHSSIGNQTKWFCGGTLISNQVVLTAARCFYSDV